ncbi:MAG: hypothetical protein KDF65_09915, partial [Anaerolineae bacterium]|nr:hypothetical protein [Anaerolineae bacterium]
GRGEGKRPITSPGKNGYIPLASPAPPPDRRWPTRARQGHCGQLGSTGLALTLPSPLRYLILAQRKIIVFKLISV